MNRRIQCSSLFSAAEHSQLTPMQLIMALLQLQFVRYDTALPFAQHPTSRCFKQLWGFSRKGRGTELFTIKLYWGISWKFIALVETSEANNQRVLTLNKLPE